MTSAVVDITCDRARGSIRVIRQAVGGIVGVAVRWFTSRLAADQLIRKVVERGRRGRRRAVESLSGQTIAHQVMTVGVTTHRRIIVGVGRAKHAIQTIIVVDDGRVCAATANYVYAFRGR